MNLAIALKCGVFHPRENLECEIFDKYGDKVAFFKIALDHNISQRRGEFERKFGVPAISPQVAMYGRFDVLNGEQSAHNFKIDVSKGGPLSDQGIRAVLTNRDYWIQQNLFGKSPDGDRKLYRYEGTLKIHEVGELR